MKKNSLYAFGLLITFYAGAYDHKKDKELETHIKAIKHVTQLVQKISSNLIWNVSDATRSTTDFYSRAMVNALEQEIEALTNESQEHELTEEQRKILELLEQYLNQYQAYSAFFKESQE